MSAPNFNIIRSTKDIDALLRADSWRMKVLEAAEKLNLPNWWIGAGFLRNAIWDAIEEKRPQKNRDVDLVYFDADDVRPETDWAYDDEMNKKYPYALWEIRNQARMHYKSGSKPFTSTEDGIAHWVETSTCVAVKLEKGKLRYLFCYGTEDLFGLITRPIPLKEQPNLLETFRRRVVEKKWREQWPHLQVFES